MKPSLKPRFDAEPSWKWRDAPAVSVTKVSMQMKRNIGDVCDKEARG